MTFEISDSRRGRVDAPGDSSRTFEIEDAKRKIARLKSMRLGAAVTLIITELDRITRADLPVTKRLALLREWKRPLVKAIIKLPKPSAPTDSKTQASGQTLQQRLFFVMARALRQTLQELDRRRSGTYRGDDEDRHWVVRNLFRFLGRQIRYGIDWNRALPKQTWLDLHDLFVYLVVRGEVDRLRRPGVGFHGGLRLNVEVEYKRLLLLGLADKMTSRRAETSEYFDLLKRWANDSGLEPADGRDVAGGVLIDVSRDDVARMHGDLVASGRGGWILSPSAEFLDYVASVNGSRGEVIRMSAFRELHGVTESEMSDFTDSVHWTRGLSG